MSDLTLKITELEFEEIAGNVIDEGIKGEGGEVAKMLYRYKNKIINYLLEEVQGNTILDINNFITTYTSVKEAYQKATKEIFETVVVDSMLECLFEDLTDEEADDLMDFIYSQEGELQLQ